MKHTATAGDDIPTHEDWVLDVDLIRYHLERVHATRYFSESVIRNIQASSFQSQVTGDLVVKLVATVAAWQEERLLEVPANWWQHFKQRWFPAWAKRKWPVLTTTYDAAVLLPKVPVSKPEWHTVEFPVWRKTS